MLQLKVNRNKKPYDFELEKKKKTHKDSQKSHCSPGKNTALVEKKTVSPFKEQGTSSKTDKD